MEGTVEIGWTFKIYEVTKYCTETHHILIDESFAINDAFFQSLPKAFQDSLIEAAQETAEWDTRPSLGAPTNRMRDAGS